MKNKFFISFLLIFISSKLFAEDMLIEAKNIKLDKDREITIFKDDVKVKTQDKEISSDYASYNKKTGQLILKDNILAADNFKNQIRAGYAEYNKNSKIFRTQGFTSITTSEKYILEGEDIFADGDNKIIKSDKKSILKDNDNNTINFENFEYLSSENIFKSIEKVTIQDNLGNNYDFSQIYIDTKKEMIGTDIKAFMNHEDFKIDKQNDPRIFANTIKINDDKSEFNKSIFTLCKLKENEKCPPWTIQASKMLHNNKNKTIYYDNAVIKIYNIPIFYTPKLSHPDPSVERRSGFLPPSFSDTKNLGTGLAIPYFWALNKDKNFTVTSKLYFDQNPLFVGEYHQAFKNSFFLSDFGYTEGYKKTSANKKGGGKSHFFAKFDKAFTSKSEATNSLNVSIQHVSDDKYLKLYKIKSNLVDYNTDVLESTFDFTHEKDDFFFGLNASLFETLKTDYNDKYEYIFPDILIDKNLFSDEKYGNLDFQTNLKAHNYDTNKLENFLVNDFEWESNDLILNSFIKNNFLANFRNINYEAKNVDKFKDETTSELFGSVGLLSKIDFFKKRGNLNHQFTPKTLVKFSPGSMRKETSGSRLDPVNAFELNKLSEINNFETGNTATLGFDYTTKENNTKKFNFSVAQVISEKENKKFDSKTSLDEKLSDLTGSLEYNIKDNYKLTSDFSIDQNYNEINYLDLGINYNFDKLGIDFNYLQENNHIGDQDYFKTEINYKNNKNALISFKTKRNLITNSSEFYNLSYEYINDCLRAGLVYRREFYNDSELEPENSLMFNITLTPFGNINSPKFNQ